MDISHNISTVGMPLVTRKPYATDDVWNCHRSIIRRLYREENKSLKQVKRIMEWEYNLFATERMFKTRIKSWGLDKKLKEVEVLRILQLKRERDAVGKKSRFSIRDQEVDWERLEHYLSRRPDLRNKSRGSVRDAIAARLDVICRTPSPGPCISALLDGPPEVQLPDEILRIFRNYVWGAWESVWTLQGNDLYGYDRECGRGRVNKMYGDLGNARTLLKRNKMQAAFRIINQSLDSLGRVIKDQEPEILYMLSYRILRLDHEIAEPLIVFISEMHTAVLGPRHPLSLVWDRLRHMSWECRARTISMMVFEGAQFLETRLGVLNRVVRSALIPLTSILYSLGETDGRDFRMVLSKYDTAVEAYFAEGDTLRSCKCLLEMAWVQSTVRQYRPARDALVRAYSLVQNSDRGLGSPWLVMEFRYYELMGSLLYKCSPGRIAESIEYEYKAYRHAEEHFQPGNMRSLRALRNLIYRCRQAGREDDAERCCKALLAKMGEAEDV
ncbi:Clr5 domain-containing protein [Colletotrichum cereale]|nr:Clr5 domain-containing protein [Colletotrichum cereale]